MKLIRVTESVIADKCDELLTLLILDERKYDSNISNKINIQGWYSTTLEDTNRVTYAMVEGNNVIGFIHGYIKDVAGGMVDETVALLDAMYVTPRYRNQGIAKCLVESFEKWARLKGVTFIDLSVLNDNEIAFNLYKKSGYIPKEDISFTAISHCAGIIQLKNYQGQGIGSHLLKLILERYKTIRQIVLMTDQTKKTINFYQKNGMVKASDYNCVTFVK